MDIDPTLHQDKILMIESLQKYISELKKNAENDPDGAKEEAKKALIRTGVATPDGKQKK